MTEPVTQLPIEEVIPSLCHALSKAGRAVLTAPPGSGKTTIVPLRLLDQVEGKIVMLEPRRLATRAAARRMASLIGEQVGETVGYVTRDDRKTGPNTRIEVVTEGVLTRRLQRDPSLPGTSLVIFDEFHERNLQTDLGLALTLDAMVAFRPDLKLLVMSATLDTARIADLIAAPIIVGEASQHPVEIRWVPTSPSARHEAHVANVVRRALDVDEGDILVFLPGMAEIQRVAGLLEGIEHEIHLLHGSLPAEQQDAALAPSRRRKVVLSTDIAETSLTVEGVTVVIDSGLARAPRFDPHTGMTRLRTISISKASAEQRTGRAGRTQPGVAYRLWSKLEHGARRAHIDPEITQVDLAGLALELAAWGSPNPNTLRFPDQPPARAYDEGRRLLEQLGAIDTDGLTGIGKAMLDLPLHPRLARMVVAADPADRSLAVKVATVLDERDLLRTRTRDADEIPVDLGVRVQMLESGGKGTERVQKRVEDLAKRAHIRIEPSDPARIGAVLALGFPDRLAIRRGGPGRFQLRTGTTAFISPSDPIAIEGFLIAADLDGKRKDARIRLAAPLEVHEVLQLFANEVEEQTMLAWNGERLVARVERRLGGITLATDERPPAPGPAVAKALTSRIRKKGWKALDPNAAFDQYRTRVAYLRASHGEAWPDLSEARLLATLEQWLGPELERALDLGEVDVMRALRRFVAKTDLDRLAPSHFKLPGGKRVAVDYSEGKPRISAKAQDLYGMGRHPEVAGIPLVVEILSPANRPIQITSDLPGFWRGSWSAVRKEMMARYPKHSWPAQPS
jgi:ATP-dependent helicase HrpB